MDLEEFQRMLDGNVDMRGEALKALCKMDESVALPFFEVALNHYRAGVRWQVIEELRRVKPAWGLRLAEKMLSDSCAHIRQETTRIWGLLLSKALFSFTEKAVELSDEDVRYETLLVLQALGKQSGEVMKRLLSDPRLADRAWRTGIYTAVVYGYQVMDRADFEAMGGGR